jgi:hypothetical protein
MSSDPKQSGAQGSGGAEDGFERELGQWMRERDAPPADLSGLFGQLEHEIAQEHGLRAWLRSRSTPLRLVIALVALLVPAAFSLVASLRPDIAFYPPERMLAIAVFLVASLTAAVQLALRPLQRAAVSDGLSFGTIAVCVLGLLALYALPAAHEAHPASLQTPGLAALLARAWPCLWIGLSIGAGVLLVLLALDRGGVRRALALATAAGACANLVLQVHCPNTARAHVMLAHFGVLAVLLAGAGVAVRMARQQHTTRN